MLTACPAFTGIKWKCTQVAETSTESSPLQTGRGGRVLLELAGLRMLRDKKVMSRGTFIWHSKKGMNKTYEFLPCPYLNSKNLVVGNE
jgi:hypothetical protein